ncbi:MAG: porin [Planctomycetaceae bacterium]
MILTPTRFADPIAETIEMNRVRVAARCAVFCASLSAILVTATALSSEIDPRDESGDQRSVSAAETSGSDRPSHLGATDPFGPQIRRSGMTAGVLPTGYSPAATAAPPIPPSPDQPPAPEPVTSPAMTASSGASLNQFAPWNPAPPCGVQLTDPGSQYPTVKVTGFFQADAVWFDQDDANKQQVGDVPDGADFRRARLAATGDVWENIGYMIEMDFAAPGRPSFMDVYADFRDMLSIPAKVRVGQWRMPFGMTGTTSVRELSFIERPLPFALVPFRQIGVGLLDSVDDDNITWAVAGFRYPTDVFGGNVGDSGGYSMATRETIVLGGEKDDDALMHFGGSYSYLNSSFDTFRTLSQPEVFANEVPGPVVPSGAFLNVPAFVDTGLVSAEQANLFGGEVAGRAGSFWTQAEIYSMTVDRSGGSNPTFWGAYAHVGYILTGEVRPYSRANGVFTRILPNDPVKKGGGLGAWEVAGRWSVLDLNDGGINGGRLTDLTAGLNWYLNPRTKMQFNYIHAFLDAQPTGESDANILAARAQIDF